MITQKDIDDLVYDFKWSKENFKDKKVTDIYRQGIYDVVELMRKKSAEKAKEQPANNNNVKMMVYADDQAIISILDKIYDLLLLRLPIHYPISNPIIDTPITYDTNKIYCDTANTEGCEE